MEYCDAIIIGAGPAGMMAAIRASERKRRVILIERNTTPCKKLLISGNGRCNLTNSRNIKEFLEKFSASRDFLRNAFARFFNADLMSFFEDAGVKLKIEEDGKVFPASNRSSDILNVLASKLKNEYAVFLTGKRVSEIIIKDNIIEGVLIDSGKKFVAPHVAIATGGLSYPQTGSTGDGYALAEKCGHTIAPLKPGLSAVLIKEKFIQDWQGISLQDAVLTLFANNKKIDESIGGLVFAHFGMSGPVVFDISASAYDALEMKHDTMASINFQPGLDHKALDAHLLNEFNAHSGKSIKVILKSPLPQGIIAHFLTQCRVDKGKGIHQITSEERKRLIGGLQDFRLTIQGVMPVKDSVITRGGVHTKEINPATMESKLISGLFFAGEVIDIDAKTGGYNMQAAFSTGWVCGGHI